MTRLYGAHLSIGEGFRNIPLLAKELGISAVQIHPSAPQRWITKPIEDEKAEQLVKYAKNTPLRLIFHHAIYLINLAQPDKQKFHLSKMAIVVYLQFDHEINRLASIFKSPLRSGGVVVHTGSAKYYPTEKEALARAVKGLNWICENSPKDSVILLETSAGAGKIIGDRFEELAELKAKCKYSERIFFALDTQHMYASGYDIVKKTDEVAKQAEKILGLENIKLIHVNDSPYNLGERKDRHANIGEGVLGVEGLKVFLTHEAFANIPALLETPNVKSKKTLKKEVRLLRKVLGIG